MGTPGGGDAVTWINRCFHEPLWLEFKLGELESGRANHEQFYKAKILELGVEEIVRRKKVEAVSRLVMGGTEKGEEMQRNALRVGETMEAAMRGEEGLSKALVLLQLMILFGQQFQKEEWLSDPLLACSAPVSIAVDLVEPIIS